MTKLGSSDHLMENDEMSLRINDTIPDLTVETDKGTFSLHEFVGDSWAILFSHPKDFTPVCTTEFGAVAQLADEWEKRGTKVLGVSVDGVEDHKKWKGDIETVGGATAGFPIVADSGLELSKAFDMLPAEAYLPDGRTPADSATVRSVFIIGPDKQLKLSMTYPMTVGRNFAEVLRALDGLQTSAGRGVATPANWNVGDDVIIPTSVSDEDAKAKFGTFKTVLPYLRMTKLAD
jgi:alkyl hydroperoxide reductase subunit AhpC